MIERLARSLREMRRPVLYSGAAWGIGRLLVHVVAARGLLRPSGAVDVWVAVFGVAAILLRVMTIFSVPIVATFLLVKLARAVVGGGRRGGPAR